MKTTKIVSRDGISINVKRFYIPGASFSAICPDCGKKVHRSFEHNYLMYPHTGEFSISLDCEECYCEWEVKAHLSIILQIENTNEEAEWLAWFKKEGGSNELWSFLSKNMRFIKGDSFSYKTKINRDLPFGNNHEAVPSKRNWKRLDNLLLELKLYQNLSESKDEKTAKHYLNLIYEASCATVGLVMACAFRDYLRRYHLG